MSVLITGGTGITGIKLAHLLRDANIPVLVASRSGMAPDGFPAVKFDWSDTTTFSAPFERDHHIDRIYISVPRPENVLSTVKPFFDLAIEKGVRQWVRLGDSASIWGRSGVVHQYLEEKEVDHALLKPTWYADIFSIIHLPCIKAKNEFFSATEDGRIPFVASQDIAQAAFELLTADSKELKNSEQYVFGPELFTYDEAAALLSEVVGRKIIHRHVSPEEMSRLYLALGLSRDAAEFLVEVEVRTSNGTEEAVFSTGTEVSYYGKKMLREYFEENKGIWAPSY